jgi:hypothetical protein
LLFSQKDVSFAKMLPEFLQNLAYLKKTKPSESIHSRALSLDNPKCQGHVLLIEILNSHDMIYFILIAQKHRQSVRSNKSQIFEVVKGEISFDFGCQKY